MKKRYSRSDIRRWIKTSRQYLKTDRIVPSPLIESMKEIFIDDPAMSSFFFDEIRRYPSLKKYLMRAYHEDNEPEACDDYPSTDHPGKTKLLRKKGKVTPETMFQ